MGAIAIIALIVGSAAVLLAPAIVLARPLAGRSQQSPTETGS